MSKVSFIGIGNMGLPMAHNLHKNSFEVEVFDLNPESLSKAQELGLKTASSPQESVKNASTIVSMLPSSPHVEKLYLGSEGILSHCPQNSLIIDCSTIAPLTARKVSAEAEKHSLKMIDAPVSGGTAAAEAGSLTFMVGGNSENLNSAKKYLEAMGKNIFHAGESGAGQTAKICNNMCLAIHMIGSSEALALGVSQGLDPKVLSEIMCKSSGKNWSLELYNPFPEVMESVPSSKNYEGGFAVDLMDKDLGLACEAALECKSPTPLGQLAKNLYRMHSQCGMGKKDFSSIIQMFLKKETP